MKKKINPRAWLVNNFRKIHRYWPPKNEAFKRCRVAPGIFECEGCHTRFRLKALKTETKEPVMKLKMDHIDPVMRLEGETSISEFVDRFFLLDPSGYQGLCDPCHDAKTLKENDARRLAKKAA